jgi:DNA repair exonuclease SbcCD ATPase subunit
MIKLEKSLKIDLEVQLTFLPQMEEKLISLRDTQNDVRDKRTTCEQLQHEFDQLSSKQISNAQMRFDLKQLRSRYENFNEQVSERCAKLEKLINELTKFQDEYLKVVNRVKLVETNLNIEHHTTIPFGSSSYGKTLEEQLNNLKQVKFDLDSNLSTQVNRLNESAQRLLYAPHADIKFTSKLRSDINELNEKLNQLRHLHLKKQYNLEDALNKSNKVDSELDELENWVKYKDHEILEDEGCIITEEQFDQRVLKYKQIKAELERKEHQVTRCLEAGNEMLKNSSNNSSNGSEANSSIPDLSELARNLSSINAKWANLNKRIEAKNKFFALMSEYVAELRRNLLFI